MTRDSRGLLLPVPSHCCASQLHADVDPRQHYTTPWSISSQRILRASIFAALLRHRHRCPQRSRPPSLLLSRPWHGYRLSWLSHERSATSSLPSASTSKATVEGSYSTRETKNDAVVGILVIYPGHIMIGSALALSSHCSSSLLRADFLTSRARTSPQKRRSRRCAQTLGWTLGRRGHSMIYLCSAADRLNRFSRSVSGRRDRRSNAVHVYSLKVNSDCC
ncbi:uncharacterized protein SCHCODRAFT_02625150 [Schizophyllum commune H4-8]|uniref:uncharacterized protein n=1 Tax=Schizophyllum commune (strain H4-8 / FGSC 9210) TaxID=578458 RepID=UPI00216085C5|nr:uncharacterized protein SCHCODRAFT_02625150 [Schizophyllum commune H4-8]KAI5892052.1 hypothetical protein SCHCODRAFT_02625150 [Schizophyllum commune H4-8]